MSVAVKEGLNAWYTHQLNTVFNEFNNYLVSQGQSPHEGFQVTDVSVITEKERACSCPEDHSADECFAVVPSSPAICVTGVTTGGQLIQENVRVNSKEVLEAVIFNMVAVSGGLLPE